MPKSQLTDLRIPYQSRESYSVFFISGRAFTCSSIGVGGTRPFSYMLEQFVSMGVRDHFSTVWYF